MQHAAHAVMRMELGKAGPGGRPGRHKGRAGLSGAKRMAGGQQLRKARVLGQAKAPPQRVWYQAVDGHGAQPFAFELQQGHGVGGQQRAQGGQQAAHALALRHLLGQVRDQRDDGIENMACCHSDSK